jgi:hypothetical protein
MNQSVTHAIIFIDKSGRLRIKTAAPLTSIRAKTDLMTSVGHGEASCTGVILFWMEVFFFGLN